jgi:glycosyltransferase involved in cell wall biosynthesis
VGPLDAGPARSLRLLVERLPRSRFELHVAGTPDDTEAFGSLPGDVPAHETDGSAPRAAARIAALATRLNAHAVVCASKDLCAALLGKRSALTAETKLVLRAHGEVGATRGSPLARMRLRRSWSRADTVVCGSEDARSAALAHLRLPPERVHCIYDPVDAEAVRSGAETSRNPFAARGLGPHVLSIGALTEEQGHEALVDALPALLERFANARLWILGDDPSGRAAEALRTRAERAGTAEALQVFGSPEHPGSWLWHADLFAVASTAPEPPAALLEALACQCPVVALAPPPASTELLHVAGCADRAVKSLDWQREWFRGGADERAPDLSRFTPEAALSAWTRALTGDQSS